MKVSLEWLKDYVALPGAADELAEALTSGGTEVIGCEVRGSIPDKIVAAQILSSEPHPNADRLSVCQVYDGSGQPRQIVCGAKNYKQGDKVPLALPGAVLGPDFKIKSGKLRGVVSDGMLCSAKELGLAEDAEGLLILPADVSPGKPIGELFPPDTVLELEVTPNRPDMLGLRGVAREVAALTRCESRAAALPESSVEPAGSMVQLLDAGCPLYSARIIRGVRIGTSPPWLAARLTAAGLRPINNVVDVTNYVLLETGQPLHAFDLAKIDGGIVVRAAGEGEKLRALDGSDLVLRGYDLVIADNARAVALAGVMGGTGTAVTDTTTDLLLESAWFEPSRIRRSSREHGLQTDSSYRFERRVDPSGVLGASARAVELILQVAGGEADRDTLVAGAPVDEAREITLDNNRCRNLLGLVIADEEIAEILERLGLVPCGGGNWGVPSFRPDLVREVDLIEEVIRMAGIHRVPSTARGFPSPASIADRRHDRAGVLRELLRGQGFSEARTSHFVSPDALERSGLSATDAVAIRNPLGAEQALLRPALLSGLLGALAHNLRHGSSSVRLFEIGRVFAPEGNEERTALGLILTGAAGTASWKKPAVEADFFDLKGVLEAALGGLNFATPDVGGLAVRVEGAGIGGVLRRLPRELAVAHDAKAPVLYAEILIDGWLEFPGLAVRLSPLPKFPAVERDLSVVLPAAVSFAALDHALRSASVPHLRGIVLKDVFSDPSGERLDASSRSLTVTLTFRDDGRTLTAEEVDRAIETLRDHVKAELGAAFRG